MGEYIYADVNRYDKKENFIDTIRCTFKELVSYDNYQEYYYRFSKYADTRKDDRVIHFNVNLRTVNGGYFSEGEYFNRYLNYAVKEHYKDKSGYFYDEFYNIICRKQWMERWKLDRRNVNREEFQSNLQEVLLRHDKLVEVTDLEQCTGVNGLYIMVLDNLNQCYVGQSQDIRRRILKHWSRKDYFTGTGVDLYFAKDTTRIYICEYKNRLDKHEYDLIHEFRPDYLLNVLAGKIEYLFSTNSKDFVLRSDEKLKECETWTESLEYIFGALRDFVNDNKDFLLEERK